MPTIRQKIAIKKVLESNGKLPVSRAMLEAGYPETTASNPQQLTESKGWKDLMEQYMPESKVAQRHGEALDAMKWNDFTGEREADHTQRLKAVELNYKLTHKIGPENATQVNIGGDMSIKFVKREE